MKKIKIIAVLIVVAYLLIWKQVVLSQQSQTPINTDSLNQVIQERVFFFAQKYAIQKDIRIGYDVSLHRYVWIKSPWPNGKKPLYNPTVADSK